MELEAEGTAHALADMSQDPDHDGKRRLLLRKRINALDRAVELRIKSTSCWIDSGKEPDRGHALRVLDLINQRDQCKEAEEREIVSISFLFVLYTCLRLARSLQSEMRHLLSCCRCSRGL